MSFSLNGLIRGFIYVTIVTSLTAIGINRLAPRASHFRILKRASIVPVNGYHFKTFDRLPRILDPETGRLTFVKIDGVDSFDSATCSPWEDDQGQTDVIGRWLGRSKDDGNCQGYGLARYKFPGGQFLERVELDVMPVSRPCFDPNQPSSVLFAAGDGKLYRYTFKGASNAFRGAEDDETGVTPLTWRSSTAGPVPVAINDPTWPTDPRFKGRLIVSLTYMVPVPNEKPTMRSRLGWLQLNRNGTEIVLAGHLNNQDKAATKNGDGPDESFPTIHVNREGAGLTLAYLTHSPGELGWTLSAAPLNLDCESGIPTLEDSQIRTLALNRSHAIPIFSPDGRTLYSIIHSEPKPDTIDRFSVPDLSRLPAGSLAARQVGQTGRLVKN